MDTGIKRDYRTQLKTSLQGQVAIAEDAVELLAGQLKTAERDRNRLLRLCWLMVAMILVQCAAATVAIVLG